jgi:hypothetical protein
MTRTQFSGAYLFTVPANTPKDTPKIRETAQYLQTYQGVELITDRFYGKWLVKTPAPLDAQPNALQDALMAVAGLVSKKALASVLQATTEVTKGSPLKTTTLEG